jgi:hypothetical protein
LCIFDDCYICLENEKELFRIETATVTHNVLVIDSVINVYISKLLPLIKTLSAEDSTKKLCVASP